MTKTDTLEILVIKLPSRFTDTDDSAYNTEVWLNIWLHPSNLMLPLHVRFEHTCMPLHKFSQTVLGSWVLHTKIPFILYQLRSTAATVLHVLKSGHSEIHNVDTGHQLLNIGHSIINIGHPTSNHWISNTGSRWCSLCVVERWTVLPSSLCACTDAQREEMVAAWRVALGSCA